MKRYVATVRYTIVEEVHFDAPDDLDPDNHHERLADLAQAECERDLRLPEGWEPWVEVDDIEEEAQ